MTLKQRGKAIAYAMENFPDYLYWVERKGEFMKINRPLSKEETEKYREVLYHIERYIKMAHMITG